MTLLRPLLPLLLLALLVACKGSEAPAPSGDTAAPPPAATSAPKTATLVGSVMLPEGVDASGIMVFTEGDSFAAYTDAAGYFTLRGLQPGTYRLRASRPDLEGVLLAEFDVTPEDLDATQPFTELEPVPMGARAPQRVGADDLRAILGSVSGTVTPLDPADAAGVVVELLGSGMRTVTNANGAFDFVNVFPGTYTITFSATGYQPAERELTVSAGQRLNLAPQRLAFTGNEVFLGGPGDNDGRVLFGVIELLDAAGNPLSDYSQVQVLLSGTSSIAVPDELGAFTLTGLAARPHTVSAQAPGFQLVAPVRVDLTELPAAEVILRLAATAPPPADEAYIVGQAVLSDDGEGRGNAGITVSLAGTSFVATTDIDGNYALLGMPPGRYDLVATMGGYESATLPGIEVAGGQQLQPERLVLEKQVEPPRVVSTIPRDGDDDVTIDDPTRVVITFSQPMDMASVREAISISPDVPFEFVGGGAAAGGGAGDSRVILALTGYAPQGEVLRFGRRYQLRVSATATNRDGVPLEEDFSMSFTTGRAKVIATYPAAGAEGAHIIPGNPMRLFFNAGVVAERLRPDDIRIRPAPNTQPTFYLQNDRRTGWSQLVIATGALLPDEEYSVTVRGDVRTIGGDRISNMPFTFRFRTGGLVERNPGQDSRTSRERLDEERRRR